MISRMVEDERRPATALFGHHEPESRDLGELLHLVVIRNNRLQRLIALDAPGIVVRNEQRMLRVAVDAVTENGGLADMVIRDDAEVSIDRFDRASTGIRRRSAPADRPEPTRPHAPNEPMLETGR